MRFDGLEVEILIPRNRCLLKALFIATLRPSITIMKRNGDKGPPWRTPLKIGNSSVGDPLTNKDTRVVLRHPLIQLLHSVPNPFVAQ